MNKENYSNYNFQKLVVAIGILLFAIKIAAWYLTDSVAILTDALESIVNILAGSFTLYSLYLSAVPKDRNHPHGHGKIEFISAGIEGTLIVSAGTFILYQATKRLIFQDVTLNKLDYGIYLIAVTGIINYLIGYIAVKQGIKNRSIALTAGGKHLQSDAYSSIGLILGLILIILTDQVWIDAVVALIFGSIIIYTGIKIIRESLAGIMDEADDELIKRFVEELNNHRSLNWIDLHKVRFIKYGNHIHLDCHLTLPWYLTLREAHVEIDKLSEVMASKFGNNRFEMFVHTDDCQPLSCEICPLKNCAHRENRFIEQIKWNVKNIIRDQKHNARDIHDNEITEALLFCESINSKKA